MHEHPTKNSQAIQSIYLAGGHFVICRPDKSPVWWAWQRVRPGLDLVLEHAGPLGLIPSSVNTSALDVDAGDPGELMRVCPPMAALDSRRAGGKHLYYSDTEGRGNSQFEVYGCAGEVRSAAGYLILWRDGAGRLADALSDPWARARSWPLDLFEAVGLPPVAPAAADLPIVKSSAADRCRAEWSAAAAGAAGDLETVGRGSRNCRLFDAVRFWAYSVERGPNLHAWLRRVRVHALGLNRCFGMPLDEREAIRTAYSISSWCWSGGGARWHFDHSTAAQRRRGVKSGKVRRQGTELRDAGIRSAVRNGCSMREVGREFGLTAGAVHHICRRGVQ